MYREEKQTNIILYILEAVLLSVMFCSTILKSHYIVGATWERLMIFFLLVVVLFINIKVWSQVGLKNGIKYSATHIKRYLLCYIFLVLAYGWFIDKNIIMNEFLWYSFCLIALMLEIERNNRIHVDGPFDNIGYLIILLISASIQFYVTELINKNVGGMEVKYILGNISIYFVMFWIIYILVRRIHVAIISGMLIVTGFGIANYYVVMFRGTPIVPGDFFLIETAKTVMGNYQYDVTKDMLFSGIILLIWFYVILTIKKTATKKSRSTLLFGSNILIVLCACILTTKFYQPSLDYWNLNNSIKSYGIAMTLLANVKGMRKQAPQGYTHEYLEKLCEDYISCDEFKSSGPNIIAIMNESFSDLSVLDDRLDSNTYIPYFNALENVVKGNVVVSAFGGGTANTEYEFLTGNTMGFMPGSIPYQQYIVRDVYSWVYALKELGYYATAIHPYNRNGYNRYRVYPYLGFDEFISLEDFEGAELSRDVFVSDVSSYEKVIQIFEEINRTEAPAFIFNVTMQNHSAYNTGYFVDDTVKVPGKDGVFPDVEEYLSLVKASDDAIHILIDYFSELEEPTVILFFGDHQPQLSDEYYNDIKPISEWTWLELQERYVTPFFIWANYDIPDNDSVFTSVNFLSGIVSEIAGIPTTPYQKFLMETQLEIPVLNVNAYQDKSGEWHFYSAEEPEHKLLQDYLKIQYNNIFDSKKITELFTLNLNYEVE